MLFCDVGVMTPKGPPRVILWVFYASPKITNEETICNKKNDCNVIPLNRDDMPKIWRNVAAMLEQ